MIIQLAIPAGVKRLAHRIDRLVEPAELLVGVGELVQVLGAERLRGGQRECLRDQAHAGDVVIVLAGDIQLPLDRVQVVHAANANSNNRRIADGDRSTSTHTTYQVPGRAILSGSDLSLLAPWPVSETESHG